MAPQTLLQLCTKTAIKNVKYLRDIGELPYALARPFLLKIESPQHLRSLELQSPHITKEDKELWVEFIKRDVQDWEQFELPEESDCWYDVYCDLLEQVARAVDKDAETMQLALERINAQRTEQGAKFVKDQSVRLPKEPVSMQQKYAMHDRKMGGIAPVFVSTVGQRFMDPLSAPKWTFERPEIPRERKRAPTGIFAPVKRKNILAIPTHRLNNKATQVKQAPRALVEQHRGPTTPPIVRRTGIPTSAASGISKSPGAASPSLPGRSSSGPSLREKEARLRALTSKKPGASGTSTSPVTASPSTPNIRPSIEMTTPSLFATSPSSRPAPTSSSVEATKPVLFAPSPSSKFKSIETPAPETTKSISPAASPPPNAETTPDSTETKKPRKRRAGSFSPPNMRGYRGVGSPSPMRQLGHVTSDGDRSKSPQTRPLVMKKRPAPSIFIQPKRKKVT